MNHEPVLHLRVVLTYEKPSLQLNIVDNNKKLWLKNVNEKNGKQYFKIVIGHNIFNLFFLIRIAIKNNKIMSKKFIIIIHKTTQKYKCFFSMNNGVK